jgi:hypothetical protein
MPRRKVTLRHFAAVDEWFGELDREHGPVPVPVEWAAHLIEDWEATRPPDGSRLAG